jgi:hypothetical protein
MHLSIVGLPWRHQDGKLSNDFMELGLPE